MFAALNYLAMTIQFPKNSKYFLEQQGTNAAAKRAEVRALMPDFIVKIDSLRTLKTEGVSQYGPITR